MAVAVRSTTVEMSATSEGEKKNGPEVLVAGGGRRVDRGGGVSTQRDEGEGV